MYGNFKLGFGCMRLPKQGDAIDIPTLSKMVDAFFEGGGCYFDTAHLYHDGASEIAVREALTGRYPRDRYLLTDKLTQLCFDSEEEIVPLFESQLAACGVEYFDFYLLHAMCRSYYEKFSACNAFEVLKRLKAEGRIRHIGMSFHDSPEFLEWVLERHPEIETVQLQFNYADVENPDVESMKCYRICEKFGKPVIVMEPVKGGTLATLSEEGMQLLRSVTDGTPASFALRYCISFPQIKLVLSGMSAPDQMQDNLKTMAAAQPLSEAEHAVAQQLCDLIRKQSLITCTACRYCTDGCPQEIPIPDLFAAYNARAMRRPYQADAEAAGNCVECGVCEGLCPQHLEIRKLLKRVKNALT